MSKKILIVDDSEQNRMLLTDLLTFHGFTVLSAEDGEEGVRLALEQLPDLILMDIQMPVMNGLEAGKQLRADARTKDIKMLALSAFNLIDDRENFFSTGFDGHIAKPIDIRQLPQIIADHLGKEKAP
jgi:CheY-like chemotaxis protein